MVAKIAAENPAAIFINGDIPWNGIAADYAVFRGETRSWKERRLRVFPALGNHECLERTHLDLYQSFDFPNYH
ncbi:MAG: metallophosphoesterase [Gammaproteobacteria bacterium]